MLTLAVTGLVASVAVAAESPRAASEHASNGRVAFVLGPSAGKCKGHAGDLATANPDGSQCRVLTSSRDAGDPVINPAGSTIAFTRARAGALSIWLIGVNGAGNRQLIGGPGDASSPTWSPDGSRIAFSDTRSGNPQIYVADAHTGTVLAQLTSGPFGNAQPAWSPDGTQIAFISDQAGAGRLLVMRSDGTNPRPLAVDEGVDSTPTWSPDSRRVAYASDQLHPGRSQIYAVSANGTGESRVTNDALNDRSPSWSPDGRLIAFTSSSVGKRMIALTSPTGHPGPRSLPHFPGGQLSWAQLRPPTAPTPGLTINATPHGSVDVQPDGSSLAEPLNGPASVSVRPGAPTIFRPGRGASVQLSTRLRGGRSAVLTITGGAVKVSQPAGQSTQIILLGNAARQCPRGSGASAAYFLDSPRWRIRSRGNAHPRAVHGHVILGFQGTDVAASDVCRGPNGFHFKVFSGSVTVGLMTMTPSGRLKLHSVGVYRARGRYSEGTVRG